MEINLLSENKLRISLTKNDMTALGIKSGVFDGDCFKESAPFKSLLESARVKTGFDASDGMLTVSVYKTSSGGCDMYITRSLRMRSKTRDSEKYESVILRYDREEDMSYACRAIDSVGYSQESSAYYEKNADGYKYYLILKKRQSLYPLCIAHEFSCDGAFLPNDVYIPYIFEHCKIICEKNAVSVLAKTVESVIQ